MNTDQKTQRVANLRLQLAWEESDRTIPIQLKNWKGHWEDIEHPCWKGKEYRRKPEPTPEEKRDAVRKQWEAMTPGRNGYRIKDGARYLIEAEQPDGSWLRLMNPQFDSKAAYRIVPLPAPTNAEQNAAAKAELQRILDAGGRAEVTRHLSGEKPVVINLQTKQEFEEYEWLNDRLWPDKYTFTVKELPALPAPAVVPWTFETCPVGAVVEHKEVHTRALITRAENTWVSVDGGAIRYETLLKNWTHNGSPCGTLEGEGK